MKNFDGLPNHTLQNILMLSRFQEYKDQAATALLKQNPTPAELKDIMKYASSKWKEDHVEALEKHGVIWGCLTEKKDV